MSILRPQVTWAERKDTVFITVDLQDATDLKIDLEEAELKFHAVSGGNTYEFTLTFPEKVDKEKSKFSSARLIHILLYKQEAKRWRKITTDSSKLHWIKCDWNKWLDTDDEEEQAHKGPAGYGDMDFSQFGNMMGGMDDPGMFGDEDDDDDAGDEDSDAGADLDVPLDEELEKPAATNASSEDAVKEEQKEPVSNDGATAAQA